MSTFKSISIATILAGLLVGCGGGSGSSSSTTLNKATFIDDFVAGIKYVNGTNEGFTDSNGQFPYDSGSVEFYIGDIRLGTLSSVPVDNKIFIQDLVGVSRTDTTNSEVIKIGRFLQSLDSDKSTDKIEITRTDFDKFEDTNDTKSNLNDNSVIVDTLLSNVGFANKDIVSAAKAQSHIENILEFHGEKTTSTTLSLTSSNINYGDTNINEDTDIKLTFNDDIPRKYLTNDYFILTTNDNTNTRVNTTITRDQNVVTVTPNSDLDNSENYTLTIKNTIKSYAGTDINLDGNTDKIIVFTTQSANLAPVANAGVDQIVTQGTSVTLDAGASSDSDGTISSYSWAEGSTILSTNSSFNKSDFSVGTHTITLTVTDDDGATSSDDVTITVNQSSNVIPVANAGADQTVTEGSTVTLDGSASTDSDGTIVSYQWMEGSTLLSSNESFTKSDFSVGTHTLALTVTDDNNGVHTDTVTITVNAASSGGNTGGNSNPFIIDIDTSKIPSTSVGNNTSNTTFNIRNLMSGSALSIDCENDGTAETTLTYNNLYSCTYQNPGTYQVAISETTSGNQSLIHFGEDNVSWDTHKIIEVAQWGDIKWASMDKLFYKGQYFTGINSSAGIPDLSQATTLAFTFADTPLFNADLSSWDVSNISSLRSTFLAARIFNGDITNWNTSNVTTMYNTFGGARAFNQDISSWDTSSVNTMYTMFEGAIAFNQDISSWDVSSVTNMAYMFRSAFAFNQDISTWQIQNVTNMNNMFNNASAFNQDLSALYPRKNTSLTVSDIFTNSGMTQANQDSFLVGPASSTPLNAVITAQSQSGIPFCSPSQRVGSEFISFTGSSSTGNIVSYTWTDVTAGNNTNFIDGGTTVSETYSCVGLPGGTRTIRLTVEDSLGNTDTHDQTINVVY